MATVQLPDGSEKTYTSPCTVHQVAESISSRLANAAIAGKIDDTVVGLDTTLPEDTICRVQILTNKDPEALDVMRHSCAHVMARAIMRLFPGVQLAFGPATEEGFYYDFDLQHALSDDDFLAIEAEMKRLVELGETFERIEKDRESAEIRCGDWGGQITLRRGRLLERGSILSTASKGLRHRIFHNQRIGRTPRPN